MTVLDIPKLARLPRTRPQVNVAYCKTIKREKKTIQYRYSSGTVIKGNPHYKVLYIGVNNPLGPYP